MAIEKLKGLAKAGAIYQDRTQRVKELQQEGRKIFGYLCIYPVTEMLTALDIVPFRLFGDIDEPITKANNYLPTVVCPFLRSFLDLGLKGRYSFLDGIITSHICDVGAGLPAIWNYAVKTPYSYHLDMPHTMRESALDYNRKLLDSLQESLEQYTGKKLTREKLVAAIEIHNRQRALVRDLYNLRKTSPPVKTIYNVPNSERSRNNF